MSFIELRGVDKKYTLGSTSVSALTDINLNIEQGEFTAIWGPSGSGKSTLLNILATIDTPSRGSYHFKNRDLSQLDDKSLTKLRQFEIGIIFQQFNLIPVLTALENVLLPMQVSNAKDGDFNSINLKTRAMILLEEVGIADFANQRPDLLSGGQRQRVAIARALISQPEFVIADEPTANLDTDTSQKIIELMRDLNRKHQTTFLFSTHHHLLIEAATRTIQLLDGRIIDTHCGNRPNKIETLAEANLC